ncbi:unnamed protein product, partial [Staurois parvus]
MPIPPISCDSGCPQSLHIMCIPVSQSPPYHVIQVFQSPPYHVIQVFQSPSQSCDSSAAI